MKKLCFVAACLMMIAGFFSCTKTSVITSKDALLTTSADTLHFDTVFTTTGSVTNRLKIFNPNEQILRISRIELMGGAASFFKMNVDGTPGTVFNNIEIAAGDSAYVFVSVKINATAANLPFIVQDSILVEYNGNSRFVQLDAFGQNAHFLRGNRLSRNTTWNNDLPYVILGGLQVDAGTTLTINEGCRIYAHADAPIIINGTLRVMGKVYDSTRVTFAGDRLDVDYRDYPGSWPGIYFSETSTGNVLNYAIIKNAYQGIITQQFTAGTTKVTLNECIIDNIYDAGILSLNSSIAARNCLISNCGFNVVIGGGGNYNFTHCTIASFSNLFINHKNPVVTISNATAQNQVNDLTASFVNCIIWGDSGIVKNEIVVDKKGTAPFAATFQNVLYRSNEVPAAAAFVNSIRNQSPQFDSIDNGRRFYNFRLKSTSPAIDKGVNTNVAADIDGRPRGGAAGPPDLGAYEF